MKNCYQAEEYTFQQAEQCEQFHMQNDYKMNLLNTFWRDHIWKHEMEHERCYKNERFHGLSSNEEKDRSFLACHNKWVKNLKEKVTVDLKARAHELLS